MKNFMVKNLFLCLFLAGTFYQAIAQKAPYRGERLIFTSEGNQHDRGDWASTPFTLALFSALELQDQLMVFAFSDHTWGSNQFIYGADAQMRESAFLGARNFGFKKTKFIEAQTAPNYAIIEIIEQINKSSEKNPLTILVGGPMESVGSALNEADSSKLKYVQVISNSKWDHEHAEKPLEGESHKGWTWEKIKENFEPKGVQLVDLEEERKTAYALQSSLEELSWLTSSPQKEEKPFQKGSWVWLYGRMEASQHEGKVDLTDLALVMYLLRGNDSPSLMEVKFILESPQKFKLN
ncbi:MAG: hypothetical protein ACKO44_11685 [Algoriphagus sp.]